MQAARPARHYAGICKLVLRILTRPEAGLFLCYQPDIQQTSSATGTNPRATSQGVRFARIKVSISGLTPLVAAQFPSLPGIRGVPGSASCELAACDRWNRLRVRRCLRPPCHASLQPACFVLQPLPAATSACRRSCRPVYSLCAIILSLIACLSSALAPALRQPVDHVCKPVGIGPSRSARPYLKVFVVRAFFLVAPRTWHVLIGSSSGTSADGSSHG